MIFNKPNGRAFEVLFFMSCMLFTLRSYYFYSISLAPGPVLATLILLALMYIYKPKINKNDLKFISFLMIFFTLSSFGSLLSDSPYINSVIGLIINFLIFTSIIALKNRIRVSLSGLNYLFVIHSTFFIIQLLAYYVFNEKIDYLEPITGEIQRVSGFERIEEYGGVAVFRPSGLFSEPSSYCVFMITLLWVCKKANCLSNKVEAFVLLTIFISFSLSGIIFSLFYLFLTNVKKLSIKNIFVSLIILSVFSFLMREQIISYYEYRVMNLDSDNSTSERLLMFTLFYDLEIAYQLFGSGIGNDIIDIPLTTVPSLLVYLGIIGTSVFLIYLYFTFVYYKVSWDTIFFLLIISFNFYKISNPYVWFILSMLLIVSNRESWDSLDEKKYNT
ncbi:hypothetical protein QGM67_17835 [Vibrio cholerae]|uniref:hypothetical protein n=1 Tax=Vibrio cholerae TaxID=666 RepID=UPI002478F99E|nr:hypothetical protein [Vibrio cholerae]MDH7616589.1 hypothetical protein [Vibrio cholerae]